MSTRVKNNTGKTEQKFVNKHLLQHGLLSLEINGVLNKPLLLEQCQCQREFAVKKKKLHTCPGKLPSHYCVYLTWMRWCLPVKCAVTRGLLPNTCDQQDEPGRMLLLNRVFAVKCSFLLMQWNNNMIHHLFFIILHNPLCVCLLSLDFHQLRQSIQSMSQ